MIRELLGTLCLKVLKVKSAGAGRSRERTLCRLIRCADELSQGALGPEVLLLDLKSLQQLDAALTLSWNSMMWCWCCMCMYRPVEEKWRVGIL